MRIIKIEATGGFCHIITHNCLTFLFLQSHIGVKSNDTKHKTAAKKFNQKNISKLFTASDFSSLKYSYSVVYFFIFIKVKTDAVKIVERMKAEYKILIKSYEGVGNFGTCLRVSIGEKKYMERFTEALFEIDK